MKKIKLNYFTTRFGRKGARLGGRHEIDWGMKEDGSTRLGERKTRSGREGRDWGGKDEIGEGRTRLGRERGDWGEKDEIAEGRTRLGREGRDW